MLAYALLLLMTVAGYAAVPPWVVLLGAVGVASEGWWLKLQRLYKQSHTPWSAKTTAYFVTGIAANISLSAIAYGAGRIARALAG